MKLNLFTTIIEHCTYPEWVDVAAQVSDEVLNTIEYEITGNRVKHGFNMQGDLRLKPLVEIIGKKSRIFLTEQGYNIEEHVLVFDSFWPQTFNSKGGGHHDIHVHSNSHVSGFYFIECGPNSSYPVFHDPRVGKNMIQLPELDTTKMTSASACVHFKPNPGSLFIFNSFVPHSYPYDFGLEPFKFIHFTLTALPKYYLNQK